MTEREGEREGGLIIIVLSELQLGCAVVSMTAPQLRRAANKQSQLAGSLRGRSEDWLDSLQWRI